MGKMIICVIMLMTSNSKVRSSAVILQVMITDDLLRRKFSGSLRRPQCLVIGIERGIIAVCFAISADKMRPPAGIIANQGDVAFLAMFSQRFAFR